MSEMTEPEALMHFMEGLKMSAKAAHALAHMQERPQWLYVRDMLEAIRTKGSALAVRSPTPRPDVLAQMDLRRRRAATG